MSLDLLQPLLGLAAGATIGYPFGLLQSAALRHSEQCQRDGKPGSRWAMLAGKGARGAYLIVTLLVIQLICPFLFRAGTQWWVSGGVLLGHAWTLVRQIALRLKEARP